MFYHKDKYIHDLWLKYVNVYNLRLSFMAKSLGITRNTLKGMMNGEEISTSNNDALVPIRFKKF